MQGVQGFPEPRVLFFQMRALQQQHAAATQPRPVWGGNTVQQTTSVNSKSLMEIQMEEAKKQQQQQPAVPKQQQVVSNSSANIFSVQVGS